MYGNASPKLFALHVRRVHSLAIIKNPPFLFDFLTQYGTLSSRIIAFIVVLFTIITISSLIIMCFYNYLYVMYSTLYQLWLIMLYK